MTEAENPFENILNQQKEQIVADEIICIVDRSGSMGSIQQDAEAGLNYFIDEQKKVPRDANITIVSFDDRIEYETYRRDINDVSSYKLTPRGMTALCDAVGSTLNKLFELDLPSETKVLVSIVTDGQENSSKEFSMQQINTLIDQCKEKGWEVNFLAANQDAMQEGSKYGIQAKDTMSWDFSGDGIHNAHAASSINTTMYRSSMKSANEGVGDYYGKTLDEVVAEKQDKQNQQDT